MAWVKERINDDGDKRFRMCDVASPVGLGERNATGEPVQVAAEGEEPVDHVGGPTEDQGARVLSAVSPDQVIDRAQEAIGFVFRGLLDIAVALLRHPDGPGTLERVSGPDQP
jgi:hypothetical protein